MCGAAGSSANTEPKDDDDEVVDKDVQPVGQDYIEEIKNDEGKFKAFCVESFPNVSFDLKFLKDIHDVFAIF